MSYVSRPATDAEIAEHFAINIRSGWKVRFRHMALESVHHRAANGVSHRCYNRSKITVKDDGLYVQHHGRLLKLKATYFTLEGTRPFVAQLSVY